MSFQLCDAPPVGDLAFYSKYRGLRGYDYEVAVQIAYWTKQEEISRTEANLGRHALAYGLKAELVATSTVGHEVAPGWHIITAAEAEYKSQRLLSALAISKLVRALWNSNADIQDGWALGSAEAVLDTNDDSHHNPLPARLHLLVSEADLIFPPAPADPQIDVWYQNNSLFVRRLRPAQITPATTRRLVNDDIGIPFKEMDSLMPFVTLKP